MRWLALALVALAMGLLVGAGRTDGAGGAHLSAAWQFDRTLAISWQADDRACLMIADSAEVGAARYLLACAEAGAGTLRYTGVDVNYQPRAGRVLLLVDAERILDPPLAALTIPPGPHLVAAPWVAGAP
jgi:hypothetical protein